MSAGEVLAQLTDLHVRRDEQADAWDRRIAIAVDAVLQMRPRPVAVLLTGDLVNTGLREEYDRLGEVLAPLVGAGHELLPLVGNHDDRALLRERFSFVPEVAALGDARHVQYVATRGTFRIIALDTQRTGSDAGKLCDTRLAWLEQQLAAPGTEPAILAMHHQPGVVALPAFDDIGLPADQQRRLAALLEAAPVAVERIVHGHVHRTITSMHGGVATFGCPSVGLPARPDRKSVV